MTIRRFMSAAAFTALATPAFGADLTVFDWAGYEDPGFFPQYQEAHGTPTFAFFGDEEEAFQKMRAGFRADISHPCSQSVPKWIEAGLIEPLDTSRIEGWDKLNPKFREIPAFQKDGEYYFMPADWGSTTLTYNPEKVTAEQASTLQIFRDPAMAGKISLPDNVDDVYALAFLATGVDDWTKATDEDFQRASAWLREVQPNVVAYWADGASLAQMMTSGEVTAAWAWNETHATLGWEGIPIASNPNTKEGSSAWVCGYTLMSGGEGNKDEAYEFLSSWASDQSADYIVENWGYGHANAEEMAKMDPALLDSVGLSPATGPVLWQGPVDHEMREKMIAEFEMIKAGF